jgi:hypothetical protein
VEAATAVVIADLMLAEQRIPRVLPVRIQRYDPQAGTPGGKEEKF